MNLIIESGENPLIKINTMKQKEEKFEKVVEWKEKPNIRYIFPAILSGLTGILLFLYSFLNLIGNAEPFHLLVIFLILGAFNMFMGLIFFLMIFGEEKNVYWRKIK